MLTHVLTEIVHDDPRMSPHGRAPGKCGCVRLAYFLVVLGSLQGCSDPSPLPEDDGVNPISERLPVIHRLPPVFADEAGVIQHDFPITNNSQEHLHITGVSRSCSCTDARIDRAELDPRETARLHMNVDLRGRKGAFVAQCIVANDVEQPWPCELRMHVYDRITFSPETLRFESVKPHLEVVRNVTLSTYGRQQAPPEARLSIRPGSGVTATATEPSTVEKLPEGIACRSTVIAVHLTPPSTSGNGSCELVAELPAVEGVHSRTLRIEWFVETPYVTDPPRVFFGSVKPGESPLKRPIVVRRSDNQPFRVLSVHTGRPDLECSFSSNVVAKQHTLVFAFDTRQFGTFAFGEPIVQTDDPVQSELRIPFAASR